MSAKVTDAKPTLCCHLLLCKVLYFAVLQETCCYGNVGGGGLIYNIILSTLTVFFLPIRILAATGYLPDLAPNVVYVRNMRQRLEHYSGKSVVSHIVKYVCRKASY